MHNAQCKPAGLATMHNALGWCPNAACCNCAAQISDWGWEGEMPMLSEAMRAWAEPLAFMTTGEPGETYTIDIIDNYFGTWGWMVVNDMEVHQGYPGYVRVNA